MRCTYFHLQRNFLCNMSIYPYIFRKAFCYLPTPFWMAFLLHVHISFTYMFIHLRGNFMLYIYIHTYLHSFKEQFYVAHSLLNQFLYYLFTFFKGNLMSYVPILRSISVPYSTYIHICKALGYLFYIHMYMVNNSHHLGTKKSSWCSSNQVLA